MNRNNVNDLDDTEKYVEKEDRQMITTKEVAQKYVSIGENKAKQSVSKIFVLGIIAGFFIAIAGTGAATAAVSVKSASIAKLINACIFPAGLAMVIIAGSELFTGNCLLIIPVLEKKITVIDMIKNWVVVYLGNFVGSIFCVLLCTYGHVYALFDYGLSDNLMQTAVAKTSLSWEDALIKGILCNILVCIAVWMTFSAETAAGKIITLFFPILVFVVCGFEHSVANMSYISSGLFMKGAYGLEAPTLTWSNFLVGNLVPVTIGNIIGGFLVGAAYWFVYLKEPKKK